MGDVRFSPSYDRVRGAKDPKSLLASMSDAEIVAALAGCAAASDSYLANILATEALNRVRRPAAAAAPVTKAVPTIEPAEHVCLVYDNAEEQLAATVSFLARGLTDGARVMFAADEIPLDTVRNCLAAADVDVAAAEGSGALRLVTADEAYLSRGPFDPAGMVRFLAEEERAAKQAGFRSFRATGEMTWTMRTGADARQLLEYEAKLNEFLPGSHVAGLCQYRRDRFPAAILEGILSTHPKLLYEGRVMRNHFYSPPEEVLAPGPSSARINRLLDDVASSERRETETLAVNAELERRIEERTRELVAANRELEAFSYSVSHDLRAPLRGIEYYAKVLEEEAGLRPTHREVVGRIRAESERLGTLIADLLALSRLSRAPLVRARVDLSAIARETLRNLADSDPGRSVVVKVEDGLLAEADPTLARQALDNLLENAWKFTRDREVGEIRVARAEREGREYVLIADNGRGFDSGRSTHLFLPFQRLGNSDGIEGTGVGLATVDRIAKRHGGEVVAESRPGAGARFYLTFAPMTVESSASSRSAIRPQS